MVLQLPPQEIKLHGQEILYGELPSLILSYNAQVLEVFLLKHLMKNLKEIDL